MLRQSRGGDQVGADGQIAALAGHGRGHGLAADYTHADRRVRLLVGFEQLADALVGHGVLDLDMVEIPFEIEGRFRFP